MIREFPIKGIFKVPKDYVDIYIEEGMLEASVFYSRANIPEQLKPQIKELIQQEFNERGMNVSVQK